MAVPEAYQENGKFLYILDLGSTLMEVSDQLDGGVSLLTRKEVFPQWHWTKAERDPTKI
jgi:hypothetical protein